MFFLNVTGTAEGRRTDALSGKEALLRRVQVSEVQAQMDVGQQLGEHGPGMHKVSHQRLSSQAGESGDGRYILRTVIPVSRLNQLLLVLNPLRKFLVIQLKEITSHFF